jgi:ubiquinone/menaquinone biosynthesis C-methylase UbiE
MLRRLARPLLRFAFRQFYNTFAFTYDFVSSVVSRGQWRHWTRAAIPRIAGPRILEVPCGTGNLLLDLVAAGYSPVGLDLSVSMIGISRRKLARARARTRARLVRGRAQTLPFPSGSFDTIVMTFPPEFVYDPRALSEFSRVLVEGGRLVWVDAGRLLPRDAWEKLLNAALDAVSDGDGTSDGRFADAAVELLRRAGLATNLEWVRDETSIVAVLTGVKGAEPSTVF